MQNWATTSFLRTILSMLPASAGIRRMKIATWNVNGIRARQAQVHEWIERERPEVLCLQEIKAASDQVPAALCEMEGYWCYWHGVKGYSGVALHVRKDVCRDRPPFSHPPFDVENRIVLAKVGDLTIASIYVPNGGKDFAAKLRFLQPKIRGLLAGTQGFRDHDFLKLRRYALHEAKFKSIG